MKTCAKFRLLSPVLSLAAGIILTTCLQAEEPGATGAPAGPAPRAQADSGNEARTRLARLLKEASLSPGVSDVAKLGASGAGELVQLAYVNNSDIAYKLRTEDITHLIENKVPDSIIAAMIERGAILRDRQQAAAPSPPPVPAVQNIIHSAPQPANTVVYIPAPASYSREPVSTVTVIGSSHVQRGLSGWNRPSIYSRPGQYRNNVSYSVWGGYSSWARPAYTRGCGKAGYNRLVCR